MPQHAVRALVTVRPSSSRQVAGLRLSRSRPLTVELRDQLQQTLGSAYTLERELGGGAMSRVFVAEDCRLRRKVVVKVLDPSLASTTMLWALAADAWSHELCAAFANEPARLPRVAAETAIAGEIHDRGAELAG